MKFAEIITERVNGKLYHATKADIAVEILFSDEMLAKTDHWIYFGKQRKKDKQLSNKTGVFGPFWKQKHQSDHANLYGVSFTRSPIFASIWGLVIFEFDEGKIAHNHRLLPIDHYQLRNVGEAEEFMVGPLKPVSSFLTTIWITDEVKHDLMKKDDKYPDGKKPYELLLSHPLLKIRRDGASWSL